DGRGGPGGAAARREGVTRVRARRLVVFLGVVAVLGIGGYGAYRSSWVRSWFGREAENPAEMEKLGAAKLAVAPVADAPVGWPQWRGPTRDGRAPAGTFRTDWEKAPPKLLWRAACGGGYASLAAVGGKVYTHDWKD